MIVTTFMNKIRAALIILFLLLPGLVQAWWNADWAYKKKISLDAVKLQQAGLTLPKEARVLIRLHMGNFSYFMDLAEQGKDIRFVSANEQTPLKYYIEKLDPINEMALIWVKVPDGVLDSEEPFFWMYYSNSTAVDGQDAAAVFDVNQSLTYDFSAVEIKDLSAYANHPERATATHIETGIIAGAETFNGQQSITIADSPSLLMDPDKGWTISAWIKTDGLLTDSVLLQRGDNLTLGIREKKPYFNINGTELFADSVLQSDSWQHLAVTLAGQTLRLYVDGVVVAETTAETLQPVTGALIIGADQNEEHGFIGAMDQLEIAKTGRDGGYIKYLVQSQRQGSSVLIYGDDISPEDSDEGGVSYLMVTLQNVSIDGWVIIGILMVMLVISWLVMLGKGLVLVKVKKENQHFVKAFEQLRLEDLEQLNREESVDDEEALDSPLLLSLTGGHARFQGSSIYRIYHAGVEEINHRLVQAVGAEVAQQTLSSQAIEAVRARMDGVMVRENQRLNAQMILLTIAISGGPFLGLLGTVMGVMITFAAIAAQGEVNVNAIAPGIAAALSTTVAGLAVAIPALFGYNYLGSLIKETSADMHVFVDEYIAKLAERFS